MKTTHRKPSQWEGSPEPPSYNDKGTEVSKEAYAQEMKEISKTIFLQEGLFAFSEADLVHIEQGLKREKDLNASNGYATDAKRFDDTLQKVLKYRTLGQLKEGKAKVKKVTMYDFLIFRLKDVIEMSGTKPSSLIPLKRIVNKIHNCTKSVLEFVEQK